MIISGGHLSPFETSRPSPGGRLPFISYRVVCWLSPTSQNQNQNQRYNKPSVSVCVYVCSREREGEDLSSKLYPVSLSCAVVGDVRPCGEVLKSPRPRSKSAANSATRGGREKQKSGSHSNRFAANRKLNRLGSLMRAALGVLDGWMGGWRYIGHIIVEERHNVCLFAPT